MRVYNIYNTYIGREMLKRIYKYYNILSQFTFIFERERRKDVGKYKHIYIW